MVEAELRTPARLVEGPIVLALLLYLLSAELPAKPITPSHALVLVVSQPMSVAPTWMAAMWPSVE